MGEIAAGLRKARSVVEYLRGKKALLLAAESGTDQAGDGKGLSSGSSSSTGGDPMNLDEGGAGGIVPTSGRICDYHYESRIHKRGQISGSTSYTFAINTGPCRAAFERVKADSARRWPCEHSVWPLNLWAVDS